MQFLENPVEESEFYNHDSNRAVAVVWPAIVENRLTDALRAYMRPDDVVAKELFRPEGALGTFGQKIRLAYMLGLYEKDLKDDLIYLSKIRNAFAHRVDISSFETPPIRDYMDKMIILKVHRDLLAKLKKETNSESEAKTRLFILSNELIDYRNSFHLCIRFIIHKLVDIEIGIKKRKSSIEKSRIPTEDH
jgi:hypothetical protein